MRSLFSLIVVIAVIAAASHSGSSTPATARHVARATSAATEPDAAPATAPALRAPAKPPPDYAGQAKRLVRSFYDDIAAGDYAAAWHELSFDLRSRLGNYHDWKAGYDTTVSATPRVTVLRADRRTAVLAVTLKATDLDACGETIHRTFDGQWQLARADHQWTATAISFQKTGGADPVTDSNDCPGANAETSPAPTDSGDPCDPSSGVYDPSDPSCETTADSGEPCDPSSDVYDPSDPSCGGGSDPGAGFCDTHECIPNFDNGNGYPVQCADGEWSDSGGIQGACSGHGGEG
jgi:hypothetical protein